LLKVLSFFNTKKYTKRRLFASNGQILQEGVATAFSNDFSIVRIAITANQEVNIV
jgi:hypothetical protein